MFPVEKDNQYSGPVENFLRKGVVGNTDVKYVGRRRPNQGLRGSLVNGGAVLCLHSPSGWPSSLCIQLFAKPFAGAQN